MATVTAISAERRVRSMEHDGCKGCAYEQDSYGSIMDWLRSEVEE